MTRRGPSRVVISVANAELPFFKRGKLGLEAYVKANHLRSVARHPNVLELPQNPHLKQISATTIVR